MSIQTVPPESDTLSDGALIAAIERVALNPKVDVEKMDRLLAMQERIMGLEAKRAFNAAMHAAKAEMPAVVRNARNDQTQSRYAKLEAISAAIDPVIHRNGLSISYGADTSPLEGHYRIVATVDHVNGHSRNYTADIPADATGPKGNANKSRTHAFGSTMSYGRRYLKLLVFDVTLVDEDDDGQRASSRTTVTPEQAALLRKELQARGGDEQRFLAYIQVDALENVWSDKFDQALAVIRRKRGRQ